MIHKTIWLSILTFALCAVNVMQAIAYPTKSALKKADHIVSLATTVTFISACIVDEYNKTWGGRLLQAYLGVLGAQSIINGMALKHERSVASILKLLLPVGTLSGWEVFARTDKNTYLEGAGAYMAVAGVAINGIKNIWDVYSLVKRDQSESIQHDA